MSAAIGQPQSLVRDCTCFDSRPAQKRTSTKYDASFLEIDFKEEGGSGDGYAKAGYQKNLTVADGAFMRNKPKKQIIDITTVAIPGKPAPRLIKKEMVDSMKPGPVVVDLVDVTGGN